jgi:UDP-N-acetylmuramoyl-tripeptide--D-alanyl-D-alanine ligase
MKNALWSFDELVAAAGGVADGAPEKLISGFSIDSRGLSLGEVFVALKDQRDGHEFVPAAFANGASAALVSNDYKRQAGDGALIRVADTLRGLEAIGRAARARLSPDARVIAVTGSAGKTGTKEMLRACLSPLGTTHSSDKSFNNHWGVPLTLARMPAATRFGVFEIGMNHSGEITPLSQMVRPHVAIVTTVEAVHLAQFASVTEIAEAKAEIFAGVEPGGVAVLNRDNPHFDLLARRAQERGARISSFGHHAEADVRCTSLRLEADGSDVTAQASGQEISYRVAIPGAHIAQNSLAVLAAVGAAGANAAEAIQALGAVTPPAGRGTRTELTSAGGRVLLIDESYNANPASMRAALAVLGTVPRAQYSRRIAVLGDMLELGAEGPALHADMKEAVDAAGADLVFACGPLMEHLYHALPEARRGAWAAQSSGIEAELLGAVSAGDAVMIKGSNGSRMAPLVAAMKTKFAG